MAYIQPNGTVCLCKGVNISLSSHNQLFFNDKDEQTTFFNSKVSYTIDQVQFVRGTNNGGVIKVPLTFDQCHNVNYMFFVNTGFSNKRYYASVTSVDYVSNDCTALTYVIDNIQTWHWEIDWGKLCFVEREHTDTDGPYEHIEDEPIDASCFINKYIREYDGEIYNWDKPVDSRPWQKSGAHRKMLVVQADFDIEKWCSDGYPLTADDGLLPYDETLIDPNLSTSKYALGSAFARSDGTIDSYGLFAIPLDYIVDSWGGVEEARRPLATIDRSEGHIQHVGDELGNQHFFTPYTLLVHALQFNGWTDHILNMWIYPASLLNYHEAYETSHITLQDHLFYCQTIYDVSTNTVMSENRIQAGEYRHITLPSFRFIKNLDGSFPFKNNKCYSHPFTQFVITNNNGSAIELKPQYFDSNDHWENEPEMRILATYSSDNKVRIAPVKYNEVHTNFTVDGQYDVDYGIDSAPLPSMSLRGDSYNIWLAQNRNTINNQFDVIEHQYKQNRRSNILQVGSSGSRMMGSIFAPSSTLNTGFTRSMSYLGGGAGVVSAMNDQFANIENSIDKVNSIVAQSEDIRQRPATASGTMSTSLSSCNDKSTFTLKIVQPRRDRMEQIDDYFTRFGYACNRLKYVNVHNRTKWTYIKTASCEFTVDAPKTVEEDIRNIFDNGVTFWVNNDEVGNYTLDNNPING